MPIHYAAEYGHPTVVQLLLDRGTDISAKDNVSCGVSSAIRLLVQQASRICEYSRCASFVRGWPGCLAAEGLSTMRGAVIRV